MVRILTVIPARGGSKRLPGKNLLPCAGRPLLDWTIDAALESRLTTRVVVSTDDQRIGNAALDRGAHVVVRPAHLATDTAPTDPVILDALYAAERHVLDTFDLVVLLQPTVPVRRRGLVDDCISRLLETGADSLLTGYPLHFVWWRETQDQDRAADGARMWRSQCPRRPRRQDMVDRELMWHEDGSVYVTCTEHLRRTGSRLGGRMELFETDRTVDIDDAADLAMAEALLLHRRALAAAATA